MSQPTPHQPAGMPNRADSGDESQERTFTIWAWSSPLEDISSGQGWVIPVSEEQMIEGLDVDLLDEWGFQGHGAGNQAGCTRRRSKGHHQKSFKVKKWNLDDQTHAMRQSLAMIKEKIVMIEPLVTKGLLSRSSSTRLVQQGADIEAMLAVLEHHMGSQENKGFAKDPIETLVTPGHSKASEHPKRQPLFESMASPALYVQTLLATVDDPSTTAFLRIEQPVIVVLSAEMLKAEMAKNGSNGHSIDGALSSGLYKVMVGVTTRDSQFAGGTLIPMPGTSASIEIKTRQKTVPENIFRSLLSIHDALRER